MHKPWQKAGLECKDGDATHTPACHIKIVLVVGGYLLLSAVVILDKVDLQHMNQRLSSLETLIQAEQKRQQQRDTDTTSLTPDINLLSKELQRRRRRDTEHDLYSVVKSAGIPESDIAYIYGEPQILEENRNVQRPRGGITGSWWKRFSWFLSPSYVPVKDLFNEQANPNGYSSACAQPTIWRNLWNDTWCRTTKRRLKQKMFVRDGRFRYFKAATWMNEPAAQENFHMTGNGTMIIQRPGIYIIHSNIHFVGVSGPGSSYSLNVKSANENQEKIIAKCVADTPQNQSDASIIPCPLWQLHPLQTGDEVYMDIGKYNWFRVENDTLHLALIKLNTF